MKKQMDENLNLERLLARCKQLDPATMIRLYFDPGVYLFYISYMNEMDFFLPPTASFIGECSAGNVRICIEFFIGHAVRLLLKSAKK